ncbi:MAG: hypothetical protein RIT45_3205 [Pseudomonadota bacterium]
MTHLARSTNRTLALLAATSALLLSACGPGPLQIKRDSLSGCVGAQDNDTLGWVSVAPLERAVRAADRIGTRAGWLAPGASLRGALQENMEKSARKASMTDVKWFDWARPMHVVLQHDADKPDEGIFGLLPIVDSGAFRKALAKLTVDPEPPAAFAWKNKDAKFAMQAMFPHPSTLLAARTGERLGAAAAFARCAQVREPESLLQVGVNMRAVATHHGAKLQALLADLEKPRGPGFFGLKSSMGAVTEAYRDMLKRVLEGTDSLELGVRDRDDDIVFDLAVRTREGSELQASMKRVAAEGPSPLLARLPASSWMTSASARDRKDASRELEIAMGVYAGLLNLDDAERALMRDSLTRILSLAGSHAAFAMHDDDGLPLAMTFLLGAEKPAALLAAMRDDTLTILRALAQRPGSRDKLPPELLAALDGGWSALLGVLAKKLEGKPVQLRWSSPSKDGLQCELLTVEIDQTQLAQGVAPMARVGVGMVGERLEVALCAGKDTVSITFGRDAVGLARAAAPGRKDGLLSTAWAKRHLRPDDAMSFGLWPAPLFDLARRFVPFVPTWPEADAVAIRCGATLERCTMSLPAVAIATTVRVLKNRGR